MKRLVILIPLLLLLLTSGAAAQTASIPGGLHQPFYPLEGEEQIFVEPYELDVYPVTNADFLAFVEENPAWRKSDVPEILASGGYLSHWESDLDLGSALADAPVTNVSWFAANSYCEAQGGRLPSEAEWEFAARADENHTDSRVDPNWQPLLLNLYAQRTANPGIVGQSAPNAYGLYDMHGLTWEWISDFTALLARGDSRNNNDNQDIMMFCGGASVGATDANDYPAFMRYAVRMSLDASSGMSSLGFRCAY